MGWAGELALRGRWSFSSVMGYMNSYISFNHLLWHIVLFSSTASVLVYVVFHWGRDYSPHRATPDRTGPHWAHTGSEMTGYFTSTTVTSRIKATHGAWASTE